MDSLQTNLYCYEQDDQALLIPEAKRKLEIYPDKEINWRNESKRRKVSMNTPSVNEGKKQFKCDICNANFGQKSILNKHVGMVHEGKKQFKCKICTVNFEQTCRNSCSP